MALRRIATVFKAAHVLASAAYTSRRRSLAKLEGGDNDKSVSRSCTNPAARSATGVSKSPAYSLTSLSSCRDAGCCSAVVERIRSAACKVACASGAIPGILRCQRHGAKTQQDCCSTERTIRVRGTRYRKRKERSEESRQPATRSPTKYTSDAP